MTSNQKFGRLVANLMWNTGWEKCPFILNMEQTVACWSRWKELKKGQ
jgi:hypothetical protein